MSFYFIGSNPELDVLQGLEGKKVIGLDLETAGSNPLIPQQSRIRLIQLASELDCFVIDLDRVSAMEKIRPILESPQVVKVIHNANFEAKHLLYHYHLEIKNIFCTLLASKLIAKGRPARHSLAEVTRRFLGTSLDKKLQKSDWSGPLSEAQVQYAATDAEILIPLHREMAPRLETEKLNKVSQLEFRTVLPVAAMELKGVFVDRQQLDSLEKTLTGECEALEGRVLEELHSGNDLPGMNTLNLNAPEQVKLALQDRGIKVLDTSDTNLRPLIEQYPFIADLLAYRHKTKIINTSLRALKEHILPETGRVHPHYHQIASASGRFACSEPNIQQVPREKEVRSCIKPEPGYLYIIADYSQVELRVAAGLSKDAIMLDAYAKGGDLHALTAALTMDKPLEKVTREERQAAKAINFGLIYAMGPRGLQQSARSSYGVEMTPVAATLFRDRFFDHYQGIRRWQRQMEQQARRRLYVRTAAGRIRSYRGEDMRVTELLNIPVQGTAAEGLKSALCIFWDRIKARELDARVVAIIHDEIIVEARKEEAEMAKTILVESMIDGIRWLVPEVPFEAEAVIGESWAAK